MHSTPPVRNPELLRHIEEKQAQQLELAAQLLRTGHPWEFQNSPSTWHQVKKGSLQNCIANGFEIRPVLVTPDDGRPIHNPLGLTAEQVGVGYRLTLKEEMDGEAIEEAQAWCGMEIEGKEVRWGGKFNIAMPEFTLRVPLYTPYPEPKAADPYSELKKAHKEGNVIQYNCGAKGAEKDREDVSNPAWNDDASEYRIKPWTMPAPPVGREWYKPEALTQKDWEEGWRPGLLGEEIVRGDEVWSWGTGPWTEPTEPCRTVVKGLHSFRTKRPLPIEPVKPEPKWVPLGPDDIRATDEFRGVSTKNGHWVSVSSVHTLEIVFASMIGDLGTNRATWEKLEKYCERRRFGETEWQPCRKEIPA